MSRPNNSINYCIRLSIRRRTRLCSQLVFRRVPARRRARLFSVLTKPKRWRAKARQVVLVRLETSPDDFHGMVAAQAIVTARGGMTSHAAVVARGMGKTCVSGAKALNIDYSQQQFTVDGTVVTKGEWITVDGSTGRVFLGQVPTIQPTLGQRFLQANDVGRSVSASARPSKRRHAARREDGARSLAPKESDSVVRSTCSSVTSDSPQCAR